MSKSEADYLKHILDEIVFLLEKSADLAEENFMRDETLQRAFSRSLEIIGEAEKNLPDDFRKKHSKIEWKLLAGMRDKIIHHYFGVDYEIVWDIIKNELPSLKAQIENIIET